MNITKIDIAKTKRFGASTRPFINMPEVYARDHNIKIGDEVEFFRGIINDEDVLILKPQKSNGTSKESTSKINEQ